jgi:hypothetical protein
MLNRTTKKSFQVGLLLCPDGLGQTFPHLSSFLVTSLTLSGSLPKPELSKIGSTLHPEDRHKGRPLVLDIHSDRSDILMGGEVHI